MYAGFTNTLNVGRFALFINVDEQGAYKDIDEIVNQAIFYSRVILVGKEPFHQKEAIAKLIKNTLKKNPDVMFEIFTKALIKPTHIKHFDNIIFNVNVYIDEFLDHKIIEWFNQANANFIFDAYDKDDTDAVLLLSQDIGINKSKVFLHIYTMTEELMNQIRLNGHNICLKLGDGFWEIKDEVCN